MEHLAIELVVGLAGSGILAVARGLWRSTGRALEARVAALHEVVEGALAGERGGTGA